MPMPTQTPFEVPTFLCHHVCKAGVLGVKFSTQRDTERDCTLEGAGARLSSLREVRCFEGMEGYSRELGGGSGPYSGEERKEKTSEG